MESIGEYAGRLKRDTIAALFPRLLQNEELVLRLIGQRFTCPLRQLAYFNSDGLMVDHTADFDLFGALNTLASTTVQLVLILLKYYKSYHEPLHFPVFTASINQH